MKILILGHGGHGKDTAAELIRQIYGLKFLSSSHAAAKNAVFPTLSKRYGYKTIEECYEDRRNHRLEWKELITAYNLWDKTRLVRDILAEVDIYVGMRCPKEYEASRDLFDKVLWVDAANRLGTTDESMGIEFDADTMTWISNNGQIVDLYEQVEALCLS